MSYYTYYVKALMYK